MLSCLWEKLWKNRSRGFFDGKDLYLYLSESSALVINTYHLRCTSQVLSPHLLVRVVVPYLITRLYCYTGQILNQFFRFPSEQKAENFRKFEFDDVAADCVLASTVVFAKPPYKCDWLELYQFDCCRACNAQFEECNKDVRRIPGGPEFCYRKQYKCQCDCLNKHRPVENSEQIKP